MNKCKIITMGILLVSTIIVINVLPENQHKRADNENGKKSRQSQAIVSTMREGEEYYYPKNALSETKDGFYFYSNSQRITYVDKATMQATPLCFNPDCEHPYDESCSAYARNIRNLQLYNGKLYADITESRDKGENSYDYLSIYEMDLDGSNRKKIAEVFSTEEFRIKDNEEGELAYQYGMYWMIANDTLYVFTSYNNGKKAMEAIDCYAIDSGEKIERIYKRTLNNTICTYGGYVYDKKNNRIYQNLSMFDRTEKLEGDRLIEMVTLRGETRQLALDSNQCEILEETTEDVALFQDELIYYGNDELQTYNRETKQFETYITLDEKFVVYSYNADDEYLYVQNSDALDDGTEENPITMDDLCYCIYDKEKKLVDKVKVPNEHVCSMGGKDAYIILAGNEFYYLDKSKIGTGKLEFIEIEGDNMK